MNKNYIYVKSNIPNNNEMELFFIYYSVKPQNYMKYVGDVLTHESVC